MPTYSRSRCEAHVAEGFGGRGINGLPEIHLQFIGEHRQLVHQRHVDMTEGVLQQLGEFGLLTSLDPYHPIHQRSVERGHGIQTLGGQPGHHLGGGDEGPSAVTRVDTLRRVPHMEVHTRLQA